MEGNGASPGGTVPDPASTSVEGEALEERDQTQSDEDQTLSDRDQTLSDRDQQASDDDQAASDSDDGADRGSHARTTAIRDETARERLEVGNERDDTAIQRDQAAKERDELAAKRDREAEIADRRALELDNSDGLADRRTLRLQDLRRLALEARSRATADRERAARDRRQAARDRVLGQHDREAASQDRALAGTDDLTGARRRGVGLFELEREIDRAQRTGHGLVVAYVDVDGLKAVNDEQGHSAGDQLLREVAEALRRHMRSYDLLIRVGGDEFLCVLPDVTVEEARRRLGELDSELPAGSPARSVSFGLSELRSGEGVKELVDRADHDLLAGRTRKS